MLHADRIPVHIEIIAESSVGAQLRKPVPKVTVFCVLRVYQCDVQIDGTGFCKGDVCSLRPQQILPGPKQAAVFVANIPIIQTFIGDTLICYYLKIHHIDILLPLEIPCADGQRIRDLGAVQSHFRVQIAAHLQPIGHSFALTHQGVVVPLQNVRIRGAANPGNNRLVEVQKRTFTPDGIEQTVVNTVIQSDHVADGIVNTCQIHIYQCLIVHGDLVSAGSNFREVPMDTGVQTGLVVAFAF